MAYVIAGIIAYLLGSIPFGYLIVRLSRGEDIRKAGSGNIGATNVARSAAPVLGILTLILDASKGLLAVVLALGIAARSAPAESSQVATMAALLAIAGHIFPVWLKFQGGKGVATGVGAFIPLAPKAVLIVLGIFLGMVMIFRYVSLASIAAAGAFPVAAYLLGGYSSRASAVLLVAAALLIVVRHHQNISRLLTGTESRFELKERSQSSPRQGGE